MDKELRELFAAIVQRDGKQLAHLLKDNRELAQAALKVGASRADAKEFFSTEIMHYVYGGDTALHVAAAAHWPEGITALLKAGADFQAINRHKQTPLHYACAGGPGLADWNPAAQAAAIQVLLNAGADPNLTAKSVAPLHSAVRNRCAFAVETLLKGGANPALKNKSGSTPADLAKVTSGRGGTGSAEAKAQQAKIIELLRASR
jgi:AcrR family transcriptional regulator